MIFSAAVVVTLFLGVATAQTAGDVEACPKGCLDSVFANPAALSCVSGDEKCMCLAQPGLNDGIRDCISNACGYDEAKKQYQISAAELLATQSCTAFLTSATATSTAAPVEPAATTQAPVTTTAPAAVPSSTTTTTGVSKAEETAEAVTSESKPASITSTASSTLSTVTGSATGTVGAETVASSASSASKSSTSTSSTAAGAATSDADNAESPSSSEDSGGLSVAAKAGIGAGAGVAVIMAAIVACCLCMRRRKNGNKRPPTPPQVGRSDLKSMQISNPLPGSGRQYAEDVEVAETTWPLQGNTPSKSSQHSNNSPRVLFPPSPPSPGSIYSIQGQRYEDMMPHAQPRVLV